MDNQILLIVIVILILFFMFNSSNPVKKQPMPLPMNQYNPMYHPVVNPNYQYPPIHNQSYPPFNPPLMRPVQFDNQPHQIQHSKPPTIAYPPSFGQQPQTQ